MMTHRLNLNSDLGESFGAWAMGSDDAMLTIVNSANVACGFHAGDPLVMVNTVALAKANGVSVGAHPGQRARRARSHALSVHGIKLLIMLVDALATGRST